MLQELGKLTSPCDLHACSLTHDDGHVFNPQESCHKVFVSKNTVPIQELEEVIQELCRWLLLRGDSFRAYRVNPSFIIILCHYDFFLSVTIFDIFASFVTWHTLSD